MPLFTSKRERHLWLWTLMVLGGIYSTLGFMPTLAGVLRDGGLLEVFFFLGFLLLIASIVLLSLKVGLKGLEVAMVLGIVAVYLLVFVRMALPEERSHLIEYGLVVVFIYEALSERKRNGCRVSLPAVIALVVTSLLGCLDEGIQALLPNRVYDLRDIGFNVLAATLAMTARLLLTWVRKV